MNFFFSAEKKEKEYYTLGCLLYFLKNEHLSHPKYVQQAAGDKVPVVRRPDRRVLLEYLHGSNAQVPKSIDKTARLEMPTHVKRTAEEKIDHLSGNLAKKAKLDTKATEQELKERLAAKLDGPSANLSSINSANLKNLSDELNREKLAAIRAKFIAQRRTRIKPEDEDSGKSGATTVSLGSFLTDRDALGQVFSREKNWRTRTSILQSSGKTFSKTITAILSSVKAREEGKVLKPHHLSSSNMNSGSGGNNPRPINIPSQPAKQLPNYNRYDQEQFHGKNHTHGFNIETTGTFSGMTLRSVTEQGQGQKRSNQQAAPTPQPTQALMNAKVSIC